MSDKKIYIQKTQYWKRAEVYPAYSIDLDEIRETYDGVPDDDEEAVTWFKEHYLDNVLEQLDETWQDDGPMDDYLCNGGSPVEETVEVRLAKDDDSVTPADVVLEA